MILESLKYDAQGLIPAVIQDADSGQVLTLAYMNRESLGLSLQEGYTCFWSRSRQCLWRKGATSGYRQQIVSITADCDLDALVVRVRCNGPACHTGETSCFYQAIVEQPVSPVFDLEQLYDCIQQRKATLPANSYTAYLFREGLDKILKKVGEETSEVLIAAKNSSKIEFVGEIADLTYHLLVLLAEKNIQPHEILMALAQRQTSKKAEESLPRT